MKWVDNNMTFLLKDVDLWWFYVWTPSAALGQHKTKMSTYVVITVWDLYRGIIYQCLRHNICLGNVIACYISLRSKVNFCVHRNITLPCYGLPFVHEWIMQRPADYRSPDRENGSQPWPLPVSLTPSGDERGYYSTSPDIVMPYKSYRSSWVQKVEQSIFPRWHHTLTWCLSNAGPPSTTLARHQTSSGWKRARIMFTGNSTALPPWIQTEHTTK